MLGRSRLLRCVAKAPVAPAETQLGERLRQLSNDYWQKANSDAAALQEVDAKAKLFLEKLQPRLENAAARGNHFWTFQYEEDYPIRGSTGCLELEDEYAFQWEHLTKYRRLYVEWFARHGLQLKLSGNRAENRDHGTLVYVRTIRVQWK